MAYAEKTSVSAEKSRNEIEKTLHRYGAGQFMYGWDQTRALVGFSMMDRQIKFVLEMPSLGDYKLTSTKKSRTETQQHKEWERACRQKWRALNLVIKAKLEAVESDITCFEDEFMAHIVLPNGSTVSEFMKPQIAIAYEKGEMPKLLHYLD